MAKDIALLYDDCGDLDASVENGDLVLVDSLENEIIISIFTNSPENDDDIRPDDVLRGGYWGDRMDSGSDSDPEPIGSRIWLLDGTMTKENIDAALDMVKEALRWMDGDNRIASWAAESARGGIEQLDIKIIVNLTGGAIRKFSFYELSKKAKGL